jgi:hypothetical protein
MAKLELLYKNSTDGPILLEEILNWAQKVNDFKYNPNQGVYINITEAVDNFVDINYWIFDRWTINGGLRGFIGEDEQITDAQVEEYMTRWNQVVNETLNEFKNILFQLIYTFYCFDKIGIRHNDSHLGNILIQDLGQSQTFYFQIGSKYVKMVTKYKVLIFDWDHGSISNEKGIRISTEKDTSNPITNYLLQDYQTKIVGICPQYGCNKYNQGFDTAKLLCEFTLSLGISYYYNNIARRNLHPKILEKINSIDPSSDPEQNFFNLEDSILEDFLKTTGFSKIRKVENFSLHKDTSNFEPYKGIPISLNDICHKS